MEGEIERIERQCTAITEAVAELRERVARVKVLEATRAAEKKEWEKEKAEMGLKMRQMEEKIKEMEEERPKSDEEKIKEAERKLEEEVNSTKAWTEELWEREMEERKRCAKNLVIATKEREQKGKIVKMLKEELISDVKEENLAERKGKDGISRWFYRVEREEEKRLILGKKEKIKEKWGMKVGDDRTFRERKTRQILDKRAELERAKNKEARIRIDNQWICVEGKWERWMEREARWIEEKEWETRRKERERRRLEKELAELNKEIEGAEGEEGKTENESAGQQ